MMHALEDRRGGAARSALLAAAAVACMAAAAAVAWRAARGTAGDGGGGAPALSGGRPAEGSAAPRDPAEDRALTESEDAWRAYADGISLWQRMPLQAAARFQRAASLDPGFAPALYRFALSGLLTGRAAEAREAIQAALARPDRLPEPYRAAAPALSRFLEGALDLAGREVEAALRRRPRDPELHLLAGLLCADSCDHFDPNGVIAHLEEAVAAFPDLTLARRRLGDAYEMKSMHDWSLTRALAYAARHPGQPEAFGELGRVRIARGENFDAIEAADEIVRRGGDVFAHGLAPAFILTGDHDQAGAMYDPEMERSNSMETNLLTHLHAGINEVWRGRLRKAAEHFERGPEFAPAPWQRSRKALFYLLLGRTLGLQGRRREALAALEAGFQTVGPHPALEYALGVVELDAGSPVEAGRALRRLGSESRHLQPGWTEPWRRLLAGESALAAGDVTRALDEMREAWRLQRPLGVDCLAGHVDAYFLDALGRAQLASRRPGEALQTFEQVRALGARGLHQPEIGALSILRSGLALEALGRGEEARARYRRFLVLWGGSTEPPAEVGEARRRLQDR